MTSVWVGATQKLTWWQIFKTQKIDENFSGHRFETQVHVQTQIRLNMILTLATKHDYEINKDNLYLHLKAF